MSKAQENDDIIENAEPITQENASYEQNDDFYDGFSPLDEPVKERAYTKGNVDARGLQEDLEEPSFEAPNFSDFDEKDKEPSSFNPAMENLDKKEQMYATEQMVDTVLDVYGKAHLLANRVTKIKEDKVAKAMEDGEIDPSLQVPIDNDGNSLGLMDYVQEYNSQLSDAIKLEDDFVEKVKPPMVRVFQKKGLAMTDEQFLAVAFGTDILTKGAMIFQLVKQNNKLMSMWKEQSNFVPKSKPSKKSNTDNTPPPPSTTPPPTPTTPPPPPIPTFSEPEEFSAESMVDDMTGMKENSNFKNQPQSDGMPSFGDPSLLSDMERLAKKEKVIDITPTNDSSKKRKRGRPKKK
tara:strand:+ start:558 stop:1604 length:1047 start_codon:yes stop_codon:yes gene_type:complete